MMECTSPPPRPPSNRPVKLNIGYSPLKNSNSNSKRKRPHSHPQEQQDPDAEDNGTAPSNKATRGGIWGSLDLILSLQSKDLALERKIELAFDFVTSVSFEANLVGRGPEPVSASRLASFLSDWIQPLLISPDHSKKGSGLSDPCSDFRCWAILSFCLPKSSAGVSPNLLRAVTRFLHLASHGQEEPTGLYERVLECLSLLLLSNARAFYNAGVELWVSCTTETTHLLCKILSVDGSAEALLSISGLLLDQFANFLRFHPNPKNIFRVFVDRLLQPLLELLVLLHLQAEGSKCSQAGSLLRMVEDVLSNGLFHPVHVSGFFSWRSSSANQETRESKGINESYHRHFFNKLEKIIVEKKAMALGGFGNLFRLFVARVKARKGATLSSKGRSGEASEEAQETSKPLFEAFAQFMEPLLLECRRCTEKECIELGEALELRLVESHCMLKSMNETLVSFIQEKIYTRMEDTLEGAHFNFLKDFYETIVSIAGKMHVLWLSVLHTDNAGVKKVLPLIAREVVAMVGYFLEIEYKVLGDDLVKNWLMMFSYLAAYMSSEEGKMSSSLISEILNLGCRLINVYSELRQVDNPIFALCKAVRLFRNSVDAGAVSFSIFASADPLSRQICLKSVATLLCSQELRISISNAIKSIPEGQASGCIQQLKVDISDTLEWIEVSSLETNGTMLGETNSTNISMRAELLGKVLSEIYTIMLDSITVTATNSVLIGNSIKNLVQAIRPSFSNLVQNPFYSIDGFFSSVTGIKLSNHEMSECDSGFWRKLPGMSWICVFFFRMYISCRSLYQQSISLMPPSSSRKASVTMGSLFTVSCGMNWTERPKSMDEGYFSWIVRPSISLPDVIKSLSDVFLSESFASYSPLVYVIHVMALQRLSDLNKQIKAFEFLEERDARLVQEQLLDNANILEANGKWKDLIMASRKEAAELANFMTQYLLLLASDGRHKSSVSGEANESWKKLSADEAVWDLSICSLNDNSLPTAIWWLLCQNTDIWCAHATNKNLKKFLFHLFGYLLPCGNTFSDPRDQNMSRPFCQKVTRHHISFQFLNDTSLYEQTVLYKHFASRFCLVLKKSVTSVLSHTCTNNTDIGSLPDWSEILNIFKKGPTTDKEDVNVMHGRSALSASDLLLSNMHCQKHNRRQSLSSFSMEVKACENLLNFLSKMIRVFVNDDSSLLYASYVINLERLLVSNLLSYHGDSFTYNSYDLFSLFKSCRKLMKYLVMSSVDGNSGSKPSSFFSDVFSSSSSVLWLLKSVSETVGLPHAFFRGKNPSEVKEMSFSLINHTSSIFFMISKTTVSSLVNEKDNCRKEDMLVEDGQYSVSSEYSDAWKYVDLVAETLTEQTRYLMDNLKPTVRGITLEACITVLNWNKLSSIISCFQGFLWGMASALDNILKDRSTENSPLPRFSCVSKLNDCIVVFEDLISLCLNILFIDDSQGTKILNTGHDLPELDCDDGYNFSCYEVEHSSEKHSRIVNDSESSICSTSYNDDESKKHSGYEHTKISISRKKILPSACAESIVNVLTEFYKIDLSKLQSLKGSLLRGLLKGENPHIAFALRELCMSSAAILSLKCMSSSSGYLGVQTGCSPLTSSSMGILLGASHLVLLEMAEMVGKPDAFCFVWLDGILKYLEVVGSNIHSIDPNMSKDVYALLIDTHLRAIGKCISLQGKAATLSSHEIGSNTKMLLSQSGPSESHMLFLEQHYNINTFKARLRLSFKKFIRVPHKLHLRTVMQSLERALVGVHQNLNMVSEINTGSIDGGNVSLVVAAGIDCLDLVLESVSGQKHVLEKSIPSLIDAIFNIVLHLQSPTIFYLEKLSHDKCEVNPDAGSIILMCVEVLTKVAGRKVAGRKNAEKHSFDMNPYHVSQCLHMPVALFRNFHQVGASCFARCSSIFPEYREERSIANTHHCLVDRQFSVDLYASCCRLLCTTLKHKKRKVERCIVLLEDSVSTLLSCLETVDADLLSRKGYFAWEAEEAIKCASFLRRIYEEIRQQKDVLGRYSYYFLSTYISIYSGNGPLKTGIKRDIDEALRPGVYSLIDICTPDDLQKLHTLLGEGPSRSSLATLLNDYRLNFQYEGKV